MKKQKVKEILKQTLKSWADDDIPFLSASLAFYTTFSLVPLIIISISSASLFFGKDKIMLEIITQLTNTIGPHSAQQIKHVVTKSMDPTLGIWEQIIGIIVLIFGASGVFGALQTGLNSIWRVKPKSNRGIWALIKDRFLSFTMVMGVSFLLLVSLIITLFITTLSEALNNYFDYGEVVAVILNFILSTSIITVLFALMFKYLPDVKITWKDVWLGAFITTILFTIGKYLLGYYIKYTHTGSEFGAAAGIITILVWVYYSAHLFYLGSEFTRVYATRDGRRIIPSKKAVLIPQAHR